MTDNHPACRRLVAAVLIQSVRDYYQHRLWTLMTPKRKKGRTPPAAVFQAEHWIMDDHPRVFGFRWVCDQLAIDADNIRDTIKRPGTYAQFRALDNILARMRVGAGGGHTSVN